MQRKTFLRFGTKYLSRYLSNSYKDKNPKAEELHFSFTFPPALRHKLLKRCNLTYRNIATSHQLGTFEPNSFMRAVEDMRAVHALHKATNSNRPNDPARITHRNNIARNILRDDTACPNRDI
jgi:hypothetical protein